MRTRAIAGAVELLVATCAATIVGPQPAEDAARALAADILDATGCKGGLIVHLGCGDGRLTAALRAGDGYLVHGLDADPANVEKARAHIQAAGLAGPVSVDQLRGASLPYADNLVNLLVAEDLGPVRMKEVRRVLAPRGVAYLKIGRDWMKNVKPAPVEIDEWTHWRYDATGNPVSHDMAVGPPRRMRWTGGPKWSRHHDHMASLSAMVSAGGRVFYIMDEGPKASMQLPPKWLLTARDAFNGTILWQRPIPTWYNHLYPLKSGPAQLPRRMVAVGDRLYVTLGINAPVSELDAATGQTLRTYADTKTAEEILYSQGLLLLMVNPDRKPVDYRQENAHCWTEQGRASRQWGWHGEPRVLMAVEPATGNCLWRHTRRVVPLSLAADGRHLVYHDGEAVVCLDQASGEQLWRSEPVAQTDFVPTGWSPTTILHDGVVLYSGKKRHLAALSAENGQKLWECQLHPSGHFCPEDVMVVDGQVWSGDIASAQNRSKGTFTGRDPRTGEVESEFGPDTDVFAIMHQRCYPSKATDRYILTSWIGIEFIDPRAKHWEIHHWVRGGCIYGVMPANGLIYATPHPCACYYQSKLAGFCALAPAGGPSPSGDDERRLERGPAYGRIQSSAAEQEAGAWPTYRHDPARSGHTDVNVPAQVQPAWRARIGGKLSSMTAAGGRLYVASIDAHTVYALDATTGETLWRYVAGARVDSPPTIYQGGVLFGSADGWVYCLRAADGELAWRFRAAPDDRHHVAYGQVESVWPLPGSVLVQDGPSAASGQAVAYCVAGRSMFLDGGLRLLRLDPKTGAKLSETVLDDRDPETGQNLQSLIKHKKMPVSLPDVLSSDGRIVYMRSQRFDLEGRRVIVRPEDQKDQEGGLHLFSPTGLLDDTWFHRAYWIYGKNAGEGWGEWFIPGRLVPSGRILVFDDQRVYGYGRDPEYLCNSSVLEYRLFAAGKRIVPERVKNLKNARQDTVNWRTRADELEPDQRTAVDFGWVNEHPPLLARAMVLAGDTLFVAGPPDVVDEKEAWGRFLEPGIRAQLDRQLAAIEGGAGGLLLAVNAADGGKLAASELDATPVFDGMIAAEGRLYLATVNGDVVCMAPG